jgi:pimeloyl-ACP methyl ester carboxylesterase
MRGVYIHESSAHDNTPTTRPAHTFDLGYGLTVTVQGQGEIAPPGGTGVLLLHGGAGPRSAAGLAAALSEHAYVITPTHPGFDGTPRPDWADRVTDLALAYLDLIDTLDLSHVLVIGSSFGGWIAAEMALYGTPPRCTRPRPCTTPSCTAACTGSPCRCCSSGRGGRRRTR